MPQLRPQAAVGRELAMLAHPTRKGGWGDLVAVAGFQFGCGLGKGIAEVIQRDAVENDAKRIGFVAQFCRSRREHAPAQLALPELHDLKLLAASAFADEARAAAMRTARGWFDGVRNAMGVCRVKAAIREAMAALYHALGTSRILEGLALWRGLVERRMRIGRRRYRFLSSASGASTSFRSRRSRG